MRETAVAVTLTLFAVAPSVCAAGVESKEITARINAQGGSIETDSEGRIVGVFLGNTWATDADLEPLTSLRNLRTLDLSLTYVSDRGIERLKTLENLEELNLFAAEFITDTAIAFLRGHSNLKRLNLRGTDVTDTSLEFVAELTGLRALDISFTQISDAGLEHLGSLIELEELVVGGSKISGVGLHVLKLLPRLRSLSLAGIQRRNAGYCWAATVTDLELDTVASLSGLEELDLGWGVGLGTPRPEESGPGRPESECRIIGGIKITDLGLRKLSALRKLRSLELSGADITSDGLAALNSLGELRRLSLWNVEGLDDKAVVHLAGLSGLEELDLARTALTDEGIKDLAKMPSLRRLYVSRTKVTADGVLAFREASPQGWVSWNGETGSGKEAAE